MSKHPCSETGCNALIDRSRSRCPAHVLPKSSAKRWHDRQTYDAAGWRQLRARVRAAWLAEFGPWCPGWERPGHPVARISDLCVDHDLIAGKEVLCRACNGRKGGGFDKRKGGSGG